MSRGGNNKLTTEEFKEKAREIHGDKYNYDKTIYIGSGIKVIITCPEHGDFEQTPNGHLRGHGCPKCANQNRAISLVSNTEEFKKKAREVHGDKYNYDKTVYTGSRVKVIITCREHGDFEQTPNGHLGGSGCPQCGAVAGARKQALTTEEFKEKAREVHGDKYNYDKTIYVDSRLNVIITCREHGDFEQTPSTHLRGKGCPICGINRRTKKLTSTIEEFKEKAREIHGDKYNYNKTIYINNNNKVIITCREHGDFEQIPSTHLQGHGCPICGTVAGAQKHSLTTEEFKEKAREVHGDKYNYDKTIYINDKTKVIITCLKHGDFEQTPSIHLRGHGCPKCNSSKLENEIKKLLTENGIKFEEQKPFPWLIGPNGGPQTLDFYLPDLGIGIECQGGQHFYAIDIFGGEKSFEYTQECDRNKLKLCEEHGIKLMYYSNLSAPDKPFDYPYPVYEDGAKLIEKLMSMLNDDTDAEDTAQN